MRLLALALAALAPACAHLSPPLERPLSSRARLEFVGDFDDEKRQELADELDLAERVYLGALGGAPPRVARVVFYGRRVVRKTPAGRPAGGVCHLMPGGAVLELGTSVTGWAESTEHELHHARIGDPNHASPTWRRVNRLRFAIR